MLVRTRTTIAVVAVPALYTEPEVHALLGCLGAFTDYTGVRAREASLVFLANSGQREKRKTINGDDLLWSMSTLGFEDYIEPLKIYLSRYREVMNELYNHCYVNRLSYWWIKLRDYYLKC